MKQRFLDWFYATRHAMCAEDNVWSRTAARFTVTCECCSFYRGTLIGGLAGALVGVLIAIIVYGRD